MLLLISKMLLQSLAVGLAILVSALDYFWHDKRKRQFKLGRRILFVLSLVFLCTSIIVTLVDESNKNQKEKELAGQLKKVEEQNDGLQKGIAVLSEKSSGILEAQRGSFVSLLEDQRKIGIVTANKIEGSADLLRSRLNESFDLMQLSKIEIERAGSLIRDVTASLSVRADLGSTALTSYLARFQSTVARYRKYPPGDKQDKFYTFSDLLKALDNPVVDESMAGVVLCGFDMEGVTQICVKRGSPLLPNLRTEYSAFLSLNRVKINLFIFKKPFSPEELENKFRITQLRKLIGHLDKAADLIIPLEATITRQKDSDLQVLEVKYDLTDEAYSIVGFDIPLNPTTWKSNGRIVSIRDLRGSQMIIELDSADQEIDFFSMKMSGGVSYSFRGDNLKRYGGIIPAFYVCNFPK